MPGHSHLDAAYRFHFLAQHTFISQGDSMDPQLKGLIDKKACEDLVGF